MIEGDSSASFELAYLKYDGNDYENIFAEKINQFINWLTPESLSLFSMPLLEKLTQMHQKYGSLAEFQGIGVDIITSPPKFCRQRVRFAVREVSNLEISNYKILGQRCNDAPTSLMVVNLFHALDDSLSLNISDYGSTKEKKFYYVMWEGGSPSVLVEEFPIASEHISVVMPIILAVADRYIIFGENLQAVHYLSSTIGDLIITFIYDAPLHDSWELFITEFQRHLLLQLQNIETFPTFRKLILVGRSKNVKIVIGGESFIQERLTVTTRNGTIQDFFYKQVDEGFSNPNTHVNMKVLNWLCSIISENIQPKEDEDLLEMYCGNANHTVVLSSKKIANVFESPHKFLA
jgi:tRNA/tmRNA/rRNA uracil-C5-methylase (TrmA/RlmC/RlmD family)